MSLLLAGLGAMLGGLALLMAMVVGAIAPGYALALLAYASAFAGLLLGLAGAGRLAVRGARRDAGRRPG